MFAGHVGVALAATKIERRINVGVLIASAMLLDVLLWGFVLVGWETVTIPPDFIATHQPQFGFPYSHGLVASVGWSLLVGVTVFAHPIETGMRSAMIAGGLVFSHWLLDVLVHRPELPVAGADSTRLGLELWSHMPIALSLEAALVGIGLVLFLRSNVLPRPRRFAIIALSLVLLAFTVLGMTFAPPPPSPAAMAASSLVTSVVVCMLFGWLAKRASRDSA